MKALAILQQIKVKLVILSEEMLSLSYLPLTDLLVSEDTTVSSADLSVGTAGSLEISGSHDLDTLHLGAVSLLFDVLNREFATGGLHFAEAVGLGPVGSSSLVRDSSIQHDQISIY